jgi:hypothetical protein
LIKAVVLPIPLEEPVTRIIFPLRPFSMT